MSELGPFTEPAVRPIPYEPHVRPHCVKCGRFVPQASVRAPRSFWDDYEPTGTCATHGNVYVTWERS